MFCNVTISIWFFGPCFFSGCNFYSSSCGSLKNAFGLPELSTRKVCWDCKICRLRGERTYFKENNLNRPLLFLLALPGSTTWYALPKTSVFPKGCRCLPLSVQDPAQLACLLSPFFLAGTLEPGQGGGIFAGEREAAHVALADSNVLSVGGWEKGRSLNQSQFIAEVAHAAAGSACSRGVGSRASAVVAEGRDGERLLPPAVPLVAFALPAGFSLAKPEEWQAQVSPSQCQLQSFFLSLFPHGRSNPTLSMPSYISFLWQNHIFFSKMNFFFGVDELWWSPGLAVVLAAGQAGFPACLWFALSPRPFLHQPSTVSGTYAWWRR